jgi:hypothetical protein
MAEAILPILDDIIVRGVHRLMARREGAGPFVISGKGRYFDIFAGWKAQLVLLRERLSDECAARRLPVAEGKALLELAASEFFAEIGEEATTATGSVTLWRPTTVGGAGVIREGTRFKVSANPTASPPVKDASYVTTEPFYVTAAAFVAGPIAIVASAPGTDPNLPRYFQASPAPIVLDDTLFDTTFTALEGADAAGGSSGVQDEDVRKLAKALYLGQRAPTDGALIAGALTDAAVKHVALVRDRAKGQSVLFIADESWAWSLAFQNRCKQALKNDWLGFGARLDVRPIVNRLVALNATAILADPKFKDDTDDIRSVVRQTVRSYLDDRPDFYTFDPDALASTIASSDPRLLTCTSALLVDLATGDPVLPVAIAAEAAFISRNYLTDNGVNLTLAPPS